MELIDIGVNLADKAFRRDRDEVLARARDAGVVALVVTGTSVRSSASAADLCAEHPGVLWSTAGVHPHDARTWGPDAAAAVRDLAARPTTVAVGECGLDFNRDFSPRPDQERAFAAQLDLAGELGLPVFLHERDALDRFTAILRPLRDRLPGGVAHCFTGGRDALRPLLDLGLHVGITGWIADERRGAELREAARYVPADRLMIETDAPYLAPRSMRPRPRRGRNEPAFLPWVLAALSEAAGRAPEAVAAETTATARRFFGLETP